MTWKAHIDGRRPYDLAIRLHVYRRHADGRVDVLMADGVLQTVEEGVAVPEDAGLIIPAEALEAVAEAFHPHATKSARLEGVVEMLAETLAVERGRVDKVLGHG